MVELIRDESNSRIAEPLPDAEPLPEGSGGLPVQTNRTLTKLKERTSQRGLTNEAKRPRLHRGDERSRVSEMLRESGRQCRRGPT